MKIRLMFVLSLLLAVGCSSSKPAPQPLSAGKKLTPEEAAKVLRDAEAKQPCSEQNLKTATDQQKRDCNPTQGMFDNTAPKKPVQQPATQGPSAKSNPKS